MTLPHGPLFGRTPVTSSNGSGRHVQPITTALTTSLVAVANVGQYRSDFKNELLVRGGRRLT